MATIVRSVALVLLSAVPSLVATACKSSAPPPGDTKVTLHAPPESWCPEGFETGPSDTCFAIPEQPPRDAPVLVYLHGTYAGRGAPPEAALLKSATKRGFAVVLPRGKRGHCAWKAEAKDNFCWPQEPDDPVGMKGVVAEWDRVLWQVDALLEGGTHRRYVFGFGSGGSFAAHLATRAFFTGEAYAVVDGVALAPPLPPRGKVSTLVMSAESNAKTKELHDGLAKSGWNHAFCPRGGTGGDLKADDVETVLRFFEHVVKGERGAFSCGK
jgi:poly(3-hydroxybutyrate) depolymerase